MSFITRQPPSSNFTVLLLLLIDFPRWHASFHYLPSGAQLATDFFNHIFQLYRLPQNIFSDQGVQFFSKFWSALRGLLQVKLEFSFTYHPESNGLVVGNHLCYFVSFCQNNWPNLLSWSEFLYNNPNGESTGSSPSFIVVSIFVYLFPFLCSWMCQ